MIKKILKIWILSVLIGGQLFAHSGKPKFHLIIDTDGALDDMRSLSMFLSGEDIRVLAITCSQGTLMPESVYVKVESLLADFHSEGIPVGIGKMTGQELPAWSSFAQGIQWGNVPDKPIATVGEDANAVLNKSTDYYRDKITLIALGSLKTYADWITANPNVIEKIDKIVWYNNHDIDNGFNYKASSESYEIIRASGIKLEIVGNTSSNYAIDNAYMDLLRNLNSKYARQIVNVHEQTEIIDRMKQNHLQLWDDLVPLYMTDSLLFESETTDNIRLVRLKSDMQKPFIYKYVGQLLESSENAENRVFKNFPIDTALYRPEYAKILKETIANFGSDEWRVISMTNEIHGHTGIYSIVGAKMGIRAMEYFNVGVNNMTVKTFAGNQPPLSCLNDGIQISTGATIGQGLISVSDTILKIPTAIFEFNNQEIIISLKKEIAEQMQQDIRHGVQTYGPLTDKYWLYVEELAIKYWRDFSRFDIWDISPLTDK
ncbi:MAG: FmdE family protein [Cyclobacteriaceae bacterium]|nr:FmdE family protein [Cyclobacteriaceae bacterium]